MPDRPAAVPSATPSWLSSGRTCRSRRRRRPSSTPQLPAEIDGVIATALAKERDQRYATCTDLVHAARKHCGIEQAPPRGVSRRAITIAAAAVLIALAAFAAGLTLALGGGGSARAKPNLVVKTNTLVRINSKTNKIADVIPVGRDPESLAYGGHTVWVYNNADHTVEGIDARTNAIVVPSTAISGDAPSLGAEYREVAADQGGAWVLSVQGPSGRGLLTRVRRDVPSTDQVHLPGTPQAIAFGDGSIWVTITNGRTGALLRIDPRTRAVRKLPLPRPRRSTELGRRRSGSRLADGRRSGVTDGLRGDRWRIALSPLPGRPGNDADHRQSSDRLHPGGVRTGDRTGLCLDRREPRGGNGPTPARHPRTLRVTGVVHTPRFVLDTVLLAGAVIVGPEGTRSGTPAMGPFASTPGRPGSSRRSISSTIPASLPSRARS